MIDTKELRKAITRHGTRILNEDEVTELLDLLEAAEDALREIAWSNDSAWQSDRARAALEKSK